MMRKYHVQFLGGLRNPIIEGDKFIDTLFRDERIELDKARIRNFEACIKSKCFWTMNSDEEQRLDGVVWLMEGHVLKQNLCTKRNSQIVWRKTKDSTFIELCNEFLKLANTSYSEQENINYKCWTGK